MVVIISWVLLFLVCIILWIIVLPVKLIRIASILFFTPLFIRYVSLHMYLDSMSLLDC